MKLKSKKGFTLMEMLIVVAIIGVLAAIAIPVFNMSLDKSKQAADEANYRAAKASSTVEYLNAQYNSTATSPQTNGASGKYFKTDGTWASSTTDAYKGQSSDTKYSGKYLKADALGGVTWDSGT